MDARFAHLDRLRERPYQLYERRGWWGEKPLWARVRDQALSDPAKRAVIDEGCVLSYGELWQAALRCRRAMLAAGLERRDVILVQLPNWHEFVVLAVAAESAEIIFSFCPIQWGLRETVRALGLIRPALWFTTARPRRDDDRSALIAQARGSLSVKPPSVILARSPSTPDTLSYEDWWGAGGSPEPAEKIDGGSGLQPLEVAVTSGSTGDPKGVLHIHDSALATVQSTIRRQKITSDDVVHLAVPIGHTFGYFYGLRCALQARGTLLLQEKWDAKRMIELVDQHGATVSLGPSAFALDLLNLDDSALAPLKRLKLFTLAGDSLPAPIARRAVERLPFRISRALGMTEFGHAVSTDANTPTERVLDSLGTPQPEVELRIVDDQRQSLPAGSEGRILVRGPFLFVAYLTLDALDEDVLGEDGFFDTRDLGYLDGEGCLHITGRIKNIIRRGAETIPVSVLEDVIAMHPDVLHAVVVGVPDPRLGETPVACVQTRQGKPLRLAEILALFEREGVTKKFWPSKLKQVVDWPLGPTGKIDRRLIVDRLLQEAGPPD